MNGPHIGEEAELYAIGSLDKPDIDRIDAHVATCIDCLRRLGEAEETVLGLEQETPALGPPLQRPRRAVWWAPLAVAAALVVGFLIPHPQGATVTPHVAMLHSHFSHAQFTGRGPLAKVLYARDGSWYYIIVEGTHEFTVAGSDGSKETSLGKTTSRGNTSELFVPNSARFSSIQLWEGSSLVETAQIR